MVINHSLPNFSIPYMVASIHRYVSSMGSLDTPFLPEYT
jgi:hypothetical protein